jgi:hypothetical protein
VAAASSFGAAVAAAWATMAVLGGGWSSEEKSRVVREVMAVVDGCVEEEEPGVVPGDVPGDVRRREEDGLLLLRWLALAMAGGAGGGWDGGSEARGRVWWGEGEMAERVVRDGLVKSEEWVESVEGHGRVERG